MRIDLKERLAKILENHFMVESGSLRGYRYLEDLGITNAEKMELFNLFESEFQIMLNEHDERRIRTVKDTVSVLQQYLHPNSSITNNKAAATI